LLYYNKLHKWHNVPNVRHVQVTHINEHMRLGLYLRLISLSSLLVDIGPLQTFCQIFHLLLHVKLWYRIVNTTHGRGACRYTEGYGMSEIHLNVQTRQPCSKQNCMRYITFLTIWRQPLPYYGYSYWASECPDVKNYEWRLNPVWHICFI